jgi:transposase
MQEFIAFDSHRHYTLAERQDRVSGKAIQTRIQHCRGAISSFLQDVQPQTPVAVEATGNWYWIVQEIEAAQALPQLVHPRKAKLMMGMINKTDKLDVHGLNLLQCNGTLPTVWIPSPELRDLRELTRLRIVLSRQRTMLKNRINATLAKYALELQEVSDSFGRKARPSLEAKIAQLPQHACWACTMQLKHLDFVQQQIDQQEKRLKMLLPRMPQMQLLQTLPGVGLILSATIALERLASYCGTTPRVHASGGKVRYGRLRPDVNRYLKWAFAEAGNSVAVNSSRKAMLHVSQLYRRLKARKGHPKAIGAVARHLAEATFHVLSKQQAYRDPTRRHNQDASATTS